MVSQERACDAHVGEELDRQMIANLRLKRKFKKLKTDDNEYHKVSTSTINQMDEELVNIKADVDMLTMENVSLDEWNDELTQRNVATTSDLKSTSDERDNLKRQLKDMEEENEPLRAEMKVEKDEANLKAHQILEKLTEEMYKRCEGQIEKLATENTALKIAQRDLEDGRMEAITIADAEWVRVKVLQKTVEEMENRRRKLKNFLPHQLEFLKRMTIREFMGSGGLIQMVAASCFGKSNRWLLGGLLLHGMLGYSSASFHI
ncbi:hypothetical protein Dimus_016123 [Dionaea muscipula]